MGAGSRAKAFGPILDPLTTLAFLTGSTTRIKLDTSVLVLSYARPLPLTIIASSLDMLSGRWFLRAGIDSMYNSIPG